MTPVYPANYARHAMIPFLAIVFGLATGEARAFQTATHRLVNERAAIASPLLTDVLQTQVHFLLGVFEPLLGLSVINWIGLGGVAEDEFRNVELLGGLMRSPQHFHTPLLPWDRSGLDLPLLPRFESSIRWAQSHDQGFT